MGIFYLVYLFILRYSTNRAERERERERETERIPSRLRAISTEPKAELELTNHEIVTSAKIKSWMLNRLSHPGAP